MASDAGEPDHAAVLRIVDRDHFIVLRAGGKSDPPHIADRGAAHRAGDRRVEADPPGAGIGLVLADQGDDALLVVLVGERHGRAEPDPALVGLARRIGDLGRPSSAERGS